MTGIDRWTDATLGEYFRIKHGYAFKGEFFTDSGQHILLTPGNFQAQGGLQERGEREKFYKGTFPPEFLLRAGDVLVVLTDLTQNAPILGSPAIIPTADAFLHNQRLGKIVGLDESRMSKLFLYYLLNLPDVRSQIRGSATGSTVRHTAPDRIYAVKVRVPPPLIQFRIASILSAYDDLIENNTRRIKILEELAQMTYREWFVKFRFPGYEKVRMVESEFGPIPDGWTVEPLEALVEEFIDYWGIRGKVNAIPG
jgi:type I restriction enzyme S subunit